MEVVECLFADWWAFRRGELDRAGLQTRLDRIARELQEVLEQGRGCADSKAATFCANVLALYPALWLFAAMERVEPTNNHVHDQHTFGHLTSGSVLEKPCLVPSGSGTDRESGDGGTNGSRGKAASAIRSRKSARPRSGSRSRSSATVRI
jgi:hypothetical protein